MLCSFQCLPVSEWIKVVSLRAPLRAGSIVSLSRSSSCLLDSSPQNLKDSNNRRPRQWQAKMLIAGAPHLGRMWKRARSYQVLCSSFSVEGTEEEEKADEEYLGELRVPQAWVDPEVAARQAEWLRVTLHQWLDDEFCPEPANEEISKRCSKVFYYCLLEEQLDVGDILMQMVRGLETFSFKDSFHGAFSSANAAIDIITTRMRSMSVEDTDSTLDSTVQ